VPTIRLLGPMTVTRGDGAIELPRSQKTRALLAYLIVTGRQQQRHRLCEMFWDVADDPRGALRWSLSKLRVLVDDEDARRIIADRQSVGFEPAGAAVDALMVRKAVASGIGRLSVEELRELVSCFRGELLDRVELPDFEQFQAWRVAEREQFRLHHRRLLRELVTRTSSEPDQALAPARELVRLDPKDEAARAVLLRLLVATDRREEAKEHYHLGLEQIARLGADRGQLREAWRQAANEPARRIADEPDSAHQTVRFCVARDGVRIAYATIGEGPPLVKTANWMSHLEYDWKCPLWRHLARELSRDFRLVRYDQRGNGLSDWEVPSISLDVWLDDLEAVVDASGLERFPLLGISQGCSVAVAFAARYPQRVSHLILYGGGARGWKHRSESARQTRTALQALIREGWGRDNPAFRQVFTTLFMPDASREQADWFNELQRVSTSPENAVQITEAAGEMDVSQQLSQLRVPTLVMHATRDAVVPFEEARLLAAGIADARFVALDSQNHLLLDDEPAFARFLWEVRELLTSPR
jgi:pimeloyl-ACP methyl ester carboxylesterase/DNA-binding SARP family transcriptional activator